ncbi:Zn-dependent protease with chaperone function [Anoxybacillus vitaminiphilus]|uniref:Zn-dependent protease with chaperone function n=1 Tax=Paranoxybacillus vitaminiphilus TaxID=581036 RepID=A0A327YEQ4_9BACL|nr:M48 family metallopeptidase [Anoxybacillus vitaminiphilus]RAK19510.1 Zn-dependent protease with chaperone function [Anoxybacillus vitaminiphilus]
MRKTISWSIGIYFIYVLFIIWYLFYFADTSIPKEFKGTSADPETFLTPREWMLSEQYSQMKNLLFFLAIPYDWLIYIVILVLGLSRKFQDWAKATTKWSALQTVVYLFWLSSLVTVFTLPLSFIAYRLAKEYGINTQTFSHWLKDEIINFWVNYVLMVIIVSVLYWLIRKFEKRWWLYAWLLSIPFIVFLTFIQPVVIDPLYNDFYPLRDKELETKILALAEQANIPAEHVFEVNMSEKTNALNAYVTGIGPNSRIVLWDTTLERLQEDEILFIMAHEMGHYVMKHIYWGVAGYVLLILIGLYATNKLMKWIIQRWGACLHIKNIKELNSLPLFLLLISLLSFSASPLVNAVSRYEEHAADQYAIELTKNTEAAVSAFQELTRAGLSQVNPPYLVKIFRYGHPTILERIVFLNTYE